MNNVFALNMLENCLPIFALSVVPYTFILCPYTKWLWGASRAGSPCDLSYMCNYEFPMQNKHKINARNNPYKYGMHLKYGGFLCFHVMNSINTGFQLHLFFRGVGGDICNYLQLYFNKWHKTICILYAGMLWIYGGSKLFRHLLCVSELIIPHRKL